MRTCIRCKTKEAIKGSKLCEKCTERNKKYNAKLIADRKAKNLHISVVSKSLASSDAYGGLGSELESGNMNYDAYYY